VDTAHDGVLVKTDLAHLLAMMEKDPNPGYINYLWANYKDHSEETLGFQQFKLLVTAIEPKVGNLIRNARAS